MLGNSPANAKIQFPQSVAVGYAFRPIEKLKLEFDLDWTNWDMLNNVTLHSPNPFLDASGNPTSVIPFHWQDSFFYEFGAEYLLSDQWSARAGYIFSENSVPNKTFSATVPDSDRHVFSIGLGYRSDWFQLDIAYQYSLLVSRTVRGSLDNSLDGIGDADGRWKGDGHAIILTGTLKFD